ncbi:hypothetical protein [Paenarthrobacter sp. PH39-S1]|uniref:hypothetical protein n=1 Tax=Paenarthrobacter sp. PH39-S1 TaxID=3046204 RepID=UPI0024BB9F0E|nr:hypothetical protein [Paenarthrobacter sp. PH39-S1]MDJ0355757.1 hypothetical protein [Paenarthrobacter sp. PH39-S1]
MTRNSDFEETAGSHGGADEPDPSVVPDDGAVVPNGGEDRGRYVKGSYGKAGSEPGHRAGSGEGHYVEGDYGKAGSEGGAEEPGAAEETGRFVEADYGEAGAVPPRTGEFEVGQYAEGDYGTGGTVEPRNRSAKDGQ